MNEKITDTSILTEKDVREAAIVRGEKPFIARHCSICYEPLTYQFITAKKAYVKPEAYGWKPDDLAVGYDPSCGCCSTQALIEPRSYHNLLKFFQTEPDEVWKRFKGGQV